MNLYYLIYTSSPATLLTDEELHELLHIAREANSRFDVTGMLICLPDSYIQLIEGPEARIQQLYQNIQRDKRHFEVTTLREGGIERRFFPDWTMAFRQPETNAALPGALNLHDDEVLQLFDILDR